MSEQPADPVQPEPIAPEPAAAPIPAEDEQGGEE
jgi:hypothetical protein